MSASFCFHYKTKNPKDDALRDSADALPQGERMSGSSKNDGDTNFHSNYKIKNLKDEALRDSAGALPQGERIYVLSMLASRATIFPNKLVRNNMISAGGAAMADVIENHGKINGENIALAMIAATTAYGTEEIIDKYDLRYKPPQEREQTQRKQPEKPIAKRLNPKAPLSQKELDDMHKTQQKMQGPTIKKPKYHSQWNPNFDPDMHETARNIFDDVVQESFKESHEPNGAKQSRRANEAQINKLSNQPTGAKP